MFQVSMLSYSHILVVLGVSFSLIDKYMYLSLTCRVPPKRRRTKGKVTCTRGWPDQPGWPPRAGPRGPTGAPCSTASPPPSSRTPPATTATSSSCNVFGTGQNLCYTDFTRRGSSQRHSWTPTASLHCDVSHVAGHLRPRMSLYSPRNQASLFFLRSCLFHKFGNITLV